MSNPFFHRNEQSIVKEAASRGLLAFFPSDKELFIDIDDPQGDLDPRIVDIISDQFGITGSLRTISAGGNLHFYLKLENSVEPYLQIGLQCALGSDPVRETLSLAILFNGGCANALFETPIESVRVEEWRNQCSAKI